MGSSHVNLCPHNTQSRLVGAMSNIVTGDSIDRHLMRGVHSHSNILSRVYTKNVSLLCDNETKILLQT